MKKNTILKVLSFVLLLTFVLSAVLLTGCNDKLKDDVAKAQTDVAAAQADINTAKETIATLQSELNSLKSAVESSATSTALDEAVDDLQGKITALEETIADLQEKVEAAEAALTAQAQTNTDLANEDTALQEQITALRTELGNLATKVNNIATAVDNLVAADGFADYKAATKLLDSKYVTDENGEPVLNEYSIYAFKKLIDDFNADEYFDGVTDEAYIEHQKTIDGYALRLARSTSEGDVRAIFDELRGYLTSLPTFAERFEAELLKLEGRGSVDDEINGIISLEENQLKTLNNLYNHVEATQEQEERYQAILAARQALEDAEAAARVVAAKAASDDYGLFTYDQETDTFAAVDVLYKDEVKEDIDTIGGEYDEIVETYFTDEDMVALYGVDANVLTGYSLNKGQSEEYNRLNDAKEALDKIDLVTLPTINACPLFSDKAGIDDDIDTIDAWAAEWKLEKDSENYQLIVTASLTEREEEGYAQLTYTFIKAVETYANAMDALYTKHVLDYVAVGDQTGNMAEELAKEIEKGAENVLYRRIAIELNNLLDKADALNDAIKGVKGFNAQLDNNFAAMLGVTTQKDQEKVGQIVERIAYLGKVKESINEINAELAAKIEKDEEGNITNVTVTFDDGANIKTEWAAAIEEIFDVDALRYWTYNDSQEKEIVEGTNYENYKDMVEEFKANLKVLEDEYNALTAKVQAVYDEVKYIVKADDDAVKTLTNLQKILWANKKVSALEGVNTPNFVLIDGEEEGGTITFQRFRGMLTARVLQLVALAENADSEAPNTSIAALDKFNMNRTDEYRGVLAKVVYWIESNLNCNIDQFFGENAPEAVEEPTLEMPIEPALDEPVEPEQPEAPTMEQPEAPTLDQPQEPTVVLPSPDDYPDGEEDPDYQQAFAAYSDAWRDYELAKDDYDSAWDEYNTDLGNYNTAWDNYNTEMEEYNTAMEEYNTAWDNYNTAMDEYNAAWEAYYAGVEARDNYIHNNMAEYLLNLLNAVKDVFQNTATIDAEGNLDGKDGYILGIGNYNYPDKGNYKFIKNFAAVIAAAEDMLDTSANARDEWFGYTDENDEFVPGILADVAALPALDDIRIHDDEIGDATTRYTQYVNKYYAGAITDAQLDELTTYTELNAKQQKLTQKKAEAETLYNEIIAAAKALKNYGRVPSEDDVETIVEEVAALRAKIATYREDYCGKADTDQCKFVETDANGKVTLDAELVAYQAQAKAMIVKVIKDEVYYEEIDYLDNTYKIGTNDQDGLTLKSIFCDSIDGKSSIAYVVSEYDLFFGLTVDPDKIPAPEIPEDPGDAPQEPDSDDYDWENQEEIDAYYVAVNEYENVLLPAYQEAAAQYEAYLADPEYYEGLVEEYNESPIKYAYDYLYPIF